MEGAGGKSDPQPNMISVTSTVSRLSFGIGFRAIFEEGNHLDVDKEWDDDECVWKAANQMDWYLKRVRAPRPSKRPMLK